MGYKPLLLSTHAVTALRLCRRGLVEEGGDENYHHHHGPNPNEGGWGRVEHRMKDEEVGEREERMERTPTRRKQGHFYVKMEWLETPFRYIYLLL